MKKLYENGFPTPVPIDANRHGILMSYLEGYTFQRIRDLEDSVVEKSYHFLLDQIIRLAENGLIHSDFNEYNIIIDDKDPYNVSFIDFPQMVSTDHKEAKEFFYRDVNCIERLFRKKHNFVCERDAQIKFEDIKCIKRLDKEVKASGYWKFAGVKAKEVTAMEAVLERGNEGEDYAEGEFEEQEDGNEEVSEDTEGIQKENLMDEPDLDSDSGEPQDGLEEIESSEGENMDAEEDKKNTKLITKAQPKAKSYLHSDKPNAEKVEIEHIKTNEKPSKIKAENSSSNQQNAEAREKDDSDDNSEDQAEGGKEEGAEFTLTAEQLAEQQNYIKKALKRKFRVKKTFKSNKNKMKEISRLNKDIKY